MFVDEEQSLRVDEGLGDVGERLADELLDLIALPAGDQVEQFVPGPLELILVRAEQEVHDLRQPHPRQRLAAEKARLVERLAERKRRRLRDDRLVEIEERCLLHHHRVYRHNGKVEVNVNRRS